MYAKLSAIYWFGRIVGLAVLGSVKRKRFFFVVMQKLPRPVLGQDFSTSGIWE
jgi:hypothetical protein